MSFFLCVFPWLYTLTILCKYACVHNWHTYYISWMFGYIVNDFKFVIQQHHGEHNIVFIINQILQELLKQKASTSLIGAMI